MASLITRPNGNYWICFYRHEARHTVRLGKIEEGDARVVKRHLERMIDCDQHDLPLDAETTKWFQTRQTWLKKRIAATGLAELTIQVASVGQLVAYFAEHNQHLAPNTCSFQMRTGRSLTDYFGANRSISSITKADAAEFRTWMETKDCREGPRKGKGLAPATASRRAKHAKRLFQLATDKKWISENPFKEMKGWISSNPERNMFIERKVADQIIEALPTAELKLLFALGRYGGLRLPQEARDLKWEYVNWEQSRFSVYSQKNQRHQRKRWRVVPIFTELRPYFEAARDDAIEGEVFVIPYLQRKTGSAFTNTIRRIQKRLGIEAWPKTLQNLRVSRANEVESEYGAKLEEAWIGHSPEVAKENYLMVLESEFERATLGKERLQEAAQKGEAKCEAIEAKKAKAKRFPKRSPMPVDAQTG